MTYEFVGVTTRHLASGRPLVFGDVVDESDLTPEDELVRADLRDLPDSPASEANGPSLSNPEE
jgi:hypothetical protein